MSVNSFVAHFQRARRFITNLQLTPQSDDFRKHFGIDFPDSSDPVQAHDMAVMNQVVAAGRNGGFIKSSLRFQSDTGTRMLAKLALAVGYKLFGAEFLDTEYAKTLRSGLWERDANKRKQLPVKGTGYLGPQPLTKLTSLLGWPSGWVLVLKTAEDQLMLFVVTPTGRTMFVAVTDSPALLDSLDKKYTEGIVWLTIPSLARGEGPVGLPDYLAHRAGIVSFPALVAIEAMHVDPSSLPPCE